MTETAQAGSPTVRRMALGVRLKGHRERLKYPIEQVATELDKSVRTLRRWEAGQVDIPAESLEKIMSLFLLPPEELSEMRTLARAAGTSGWWVPYADVIRPSYRRFIGLEAEASGLDEYAAMIVPGLLQTRQYMLAVMRADDPKLSDEIIEQRAMIREMRQTEWDARNVPTRYLIDEAVLRRTIGSKEVMAEQLKAILDLLDNRPNISLRICTFEGAAHRMSTALGGFAVMSFDVMPPVAVVEGLMGDLYADRAEADAYTRHFQTLSLGAESVQDSLTMIERVRGEIL